jgi:hypothetical protein
VINVLVKHSAHVFEQPIPPNTEPTLGIDIEALMYVFYVGEPGRLDPGRLSESVR